MKTKPLLERDRHRIVASLLGIPEPFVRQVATNLKTNDRIAGTRPVASPVTPQSLARLILALCTILPSRAADLERRLGALRRVSGNGASLAEQELENLIAEAAGVAATTVDWWESGDMLVGVDVPSMLVMLKTTDGKSMMRAYHDGKTLPDSMTRFVRLPLTTLRMVALELLETK